VIARLDRRNERRIFKISFHLRHGDSSTEHRDGESEEWEFIFGGFGWFGEGKMPVQKVDVGFARRVYGADEGFIFIWRTDWEDGSDGTNIRGSEEDQ
jgi:hypothetical protein